MTAGGHFEGPAHHPELLQRPLLSDGSRTVIGRPTEHIAEMLDG